MSDTRQLADQTDLNQLRSELQAMTPRAFEMMVGRLAEHLLDIRFSPARSGFQEGGDTGSVGREGRRLRIEAKRYSSNFDARDILGGFHQAINRDPAMEAWIAAATRDIPEQLANALELEGHKEGVPVLSVDFPETIDPPLAALGTANPEIVAELAGKKAGDLCSALQPVLAPALERLRREFEEWQIGFDWVRSLAANDCHEIWHSKRRALAAFGQDVAGGDGRPFVGRTGPEDALTDWWIDTKVADAPFVALGQGGHGKTWTALSWTVDSIDCLPIVLTLPARSIVDGARFDENRILGLLGERFASLTRARDSLHWTRRARRLLARPDEEGPAILLLIDGLNENPQADWIALFQLLQDKPFSGRIRVIATSRPQFFSGRLGNLRRLVSPGCTTTVDRFTVSPAGELDQMLAAFKLTQAKLHPDLIELARVPRLFPLVIRLHERLADAGRITIHRLLWEYGRDVFGERSGRSFSEDEWREWLAEIARRERAGQRPRTISELSETTARADLEASDVSARLSDIIEGNFTIAGSPDDLLSPDIVAHALGAGLLTHLERLNRETTSNLQAELDEWLDPIADLEERAELLRAACSIMAERDQGTPPEIAGLLVAAWLQSQNLPDGHAAEATRLGIDLTEGFLLAIEKSSASSHALARSIATQAIRAIPSATKETYQLIVEAGVKWMSHVSLDVSPKHEGHEQMEADRSQRFMDRVGRDQPGSLTVLGCALDLEKRVDFELQQTIATLLDGRPLAGALEIFLRAAIAGAIRHRYEVWEDLKWLCLLNEVDPDETAAALRLLAANVSERTAEEGINPLLPKRVAALLMWLSGTEADEGPASDMDPGLDRFWDYENDYLKDPGKSWFRLERRHAATALADRTVPLRNRIQKGHDFILDPTFELPNAFIEDVKIAAREFDMAKVDVGRHRTSEDISFETLQPAVARCDPTSLAEMYGRKLKGYAERPVETFDASAWSATDSALLVDQAMADGCRSLRERSKDAPSFNSTSPSSLLLAEVIPLAPAEQITHVLAANLEWILLDFENVLRKVSASDIDALFNANGDTPQRLKNLLCLLSGAGVSELSDQAWRQIEGLAFDQTFEARGCAFMILNHVDPDRFGRQLLTADWNWVSEDHDLCRHYGSHAIITAGGQLSFEEIAPRIHPTLLARAVRKRGGSRSEAQLAADIFDSIVLQTNLEAPDPGSEITIDLHRRGDHPLLFSVTPGPMPGEDKHPFERLTRDPDEYEKHTRLAVDTARERIQSAQAAGASLYLSNVKAQDMVLLVTSCPEQVQRWLEGMEEVSADFRRRVMLAEGFYLALTEALLIVDSPQGAMAWRALNRGMHTQYIGLAGVSELILMLFRIPETATVLELRDALLELDLTNTDEGLLDLAVAAIAYDRHDWLERTVQTGRQSDLAWRRRRAITLSGFTSGANLPVHGSHPEGPDTTAADEREAVSARRRARDAQARHWWRTFVASDDPDDAFAAWILFCDSADRRALAWLRNEPWPEESQDDLSYRKTIQMDLNQREVRKKAQQQEKDGSSKFLNRSITDVVYPWFRGAQRS